MPLSEVYHQLQSLSSTSSQLKKIELLGNYLKNPEFKAVAILALDTSLVYHIKNLGEYRNSEGPSCFNEIYSFLRQLSSQKGTSKADRQTLAHLSNANKQTHHVVNCILGKDLRCGVGAALINKSCPGLIHVTPYMRCESEKKIKNISYPAFVQRKADGIFAYAFRDHAGKSSPTLITRNGNELHIHGALDGDLQYLASEVLSMELVLVRNGQELPRKEGNGILNKAIHGTLSVEESKLIRGKVWDILPKDAWESESYNVTYWERWRRVHRVIMGMQKITRIESKMAHSEEEAREFFVAMRRQGYEGAVLKNKDGFWKNHTSPDQIKLKSKKQAEFKVTGWYYGEKGKKYETCLGGVSFTSQDGCVVCHTGSGFNDLDRGFKGLGDDGRAIVDQKQLDYWDGMIGKIIEIEFDDLITDKNRPDTFSLFLPIFIGPRPDKDQADDLEYLQNMR